MHNCPECTNSKLQVQEVLTAHGFRDAHAVRHKHSCSATDVVLSKAMHNAAKHT